MHAQESQQEDAAEEVTLNKDKIAKLSPAEMKIEVQAILVRMRSFLGTIVEVQQFARSQQDVIKLNCVNDKLLQVKQLLNISEGAYTDMQQAIFAQDKNEGHHQYGKIVIGFERVQSLIEQARNCIGKDLTYLGPTEVKVTSPEVEDDMFDINTVGLEAPAYASPFS